MSALVKNGDLLPDSAGRISKQQTFDALLRVGISTKVATETTDANFDHLVVKELNVYRMNTAGGSDPTGPLEHFRSTGIRDSSVVSRGRYGPFDNCRRYDGDHATFSRTDVVECANLIWDHDPTSGIFDFRSLPARLPSNDVLEAKRPVVDGHTCGPTDSGTLLCPSQLHGAITFMHQEFGTPTGAVALLPRDEMRALWLDAEYPRGFEDRSPRTCVNRTDPSAAGCQACLDLVPRGLLRGGLAVTAHTSSEAQRYCRCLVSKQLGAHDLDGIPSHRQLQCPRDPIIESNITVSKLSRERRALSEEDNSTALALRELLVHFCEQRGLGCKSADIVIHELSQSVFSARVAAARQDALYVAYSLRVDLRAFSLDQPSTAFASSGLKLDKVTVGDNIGMSSGCGVFCNSEGSFLGGIVPTKMPPPMPPDAPSMSDPCLRPCMQSTCGVVATMGTCTQLEDMGCACGGCCTEVSPPPALPPSKPSPAKPPPQGLGFQAILEANVSGSANDFDLHDFTQNLAEVLGVDADQITVVVLSGRVHVTATIITSPDEAELSRVTMALEVLSTSYSQASQVLGVEVTSMKPPETRPLVHPSPPATPLPPDLDAANTTDPPPPPPPEPPPPEPPHPPQLPDVPRTPVDVASAASADQRLSSEGDSLPAPVWVGLAMLGDTTIGMALACLLIFICYIRPQRRKRSFPRPTDEHLKEDRELVEPQAWPELVEQADAISQQHTAPVYPSQPVDGEPTSSSFPFAVGARVVHNLHGAGAVVELMDDGRTRVHFDTGEEHWYEASSVHTLVAEKDVDEKALEAIRRRMARKMSMTEGLAAGTGPHAIRPQRDRKNLTATGAEPRKPLKREKSAMFGWDADEEHSIARPPRLNERGRDSWEQEGESQDSTISRRAKDKMPATNAEPDLGTTSTDGAAIKETGRMLAEGSKCSMGPAGVDTTAVAAAKEQAETPKADARPAAAALRGAARRLSLTPRGLPGPAERPGIEETVQRV